MALLREPELNELCIASARSDVRNEEVNGGGAKGVDEIGNSETFPKKEKSLFLKRRVLALSRVLGSFPVTCVTDHV